MQTRNARRTTWGQVSNLLARLLAKLPGEAPDENGNQIRGEFMAFSPFGRWFATLHKGDVSLRTSGEGAKVASCSRSWTNPKR
jgi:hypothetical protein